MYQRGERQMAEARLKTDKNGWTQWVVVYPNGREERCHNRSTAKTLAQSFNASPLRHEMKITKVRRSEFKWASVPGVS
jgi:hypothetical protein